MGVAAKRGWSWANTSASPGALARASGAVAACCSDVSIWQPPRLEKMHDYAVLTARRQMCDSGSAKRHFKAGQAEG